MRRPAERNGRAKEDKGDGPVPRSGSGPAAVKGIDRDVRLRARAEGRLSAGLWLLIALIVPFAWFMLAVPCDGDPFAPISMASAADGGLVALTMSPRACRALANLMASTSDPAYAVTRGGVVIAWNQPAEDAFGHPAEHALGRHCWELLAGRDVFSNRYCCEGCPVRETAFAHQPVRASSLYFKTANGDRRRFDVFMLLFGMEDGAESLVHVCRAAAPHDAITMLAPNGHGALVDPGHDELTPRELQLLRLLADGMETADIAAELCVSVSTTRNHVQNVLRKLRVHSRTAAVVKAQQLGLV